MPIAAYPAPTNTNPVVAVAEKAVVMAGKSSCCCEKNGHKKSHCQPDVITLLTCPACGLMYDKTFKRCPQCSAGTPAKARAQKKGDR